MLVSRQQIDAPDRVVCEILFYVGESGDRLPPPPNEACFLTGPKVPMDSYPHRLMADPSLAN